MPEIFVEEKKYNLNIFLQILNRIKIFFLIVWEVENRRTINMPLENEILVYIDLSLFSLTQKWKKLALYEARSSQLRSDNLFVFLLSWSPGENRVVHGWFIIL